LFFSSDRTGIANLYAIDLETEAVWQVSNVLGGAFQPSPHPDGSKIAFQSFSTNGQDIAEMPWDRATWISAGHLQEPMMNRGALGPVADPSTLLAQPEAEEEGPPVEEEAPEEDSEEESERPPLTELGGHPVGPYNPLPTLLPPRFVVPGIYRSAFGYMGILQTGGVDTLRRYGYSGFLSYRTDAKYTGGGGSITVNRWLPVVSAAANTYAVPYGDIYVDSPTNVGPNVPGVESTGIRYWDRRSRGMLAVGLPLKSNLAVFGRWSGTYRSPLHGIPDTAYRPFLPTRGFLSQLGGGLRWVRGGSNTYSISPEGARLISLNAKLTPSLLGSYTLGNEDEKQPFNQMQLTAEIREYMDIPFFANHVLAMRAAGGVSYGDHFRYGSFRLGGNYGESSYYVLPDEYISLRGWPVAAVSGDWYYLGSAEYRFPIWRVDRGTGTIPLFVRSLHGAVFADIGSAFDDPAQPEPPLLGAGVELRLNTILGWGIPIQSRLGYAISVFPSGGIGPTSPQSWYYRLGTSF
jgi:hypothetical protein